MTPQETKAALENADKQIQAMYAYKQSLRGSCTHADVRKKKVRYRSDFKGDTTCIEHSCPYCGSRWETDEVKHRPKYQRVYEDGSVGDV